MRHIKLVHQKERNNKCLQCGKMFKYKKQLNIHYLAGHTKVDRGENQESDVKYKVMAKKKFKCDTCLQTFVTKQVLNEHKVCIHKKEKNYSCDKCEKSFGKMSALKRHKETIHEKIKKYKCLFCKADFTEKRWLKIHLINQHSNVNSKD